MATTISGVSSLGAKFGYAVESTKGEKPAAFTQLERCNSVGGISLDVERIDSSAIEDLISRYIAGRSDTGGAWEVVFNATDDTIAQLTTMITAYNGLATTGKRMWFEVWSPYLEKAFYVIAQPPQQIPMPEVGQNSLLTVSISLTIEEYKGMDVAIEPQPAA